MGAQMAHIESTGLRVGRRTLLAAAFGLTLAATAAGAAQTWDWGEPVGLAVVDWATGQELPVWTHDGHLYVPGQPGARYALRMDNRTDRRVLVVMSVDGINIITGQTASYDQSGYVLDPHQSYDVTGWRKSDSEVAAFSFAPLPQSYAARTGRPGNVGVIGMAVFRERTPLRPLAAESPPLAAPPVVRRATPLAKPVPAPLSVPAPPPPPSAQEVVVTGSRIAKGTAGSEAPDEKLGTAHGAREWSSVTTVSFVRETPYPSRELQIEYDTYANLVARGVIPVGRTYQPPPRAFPAPPRGERYVPDPPDNR
jgi:hypothetical protein